MNKSNPPSADTATTSSTMMRNQNAYRSKFAQENPSHPPQPLQGGLNSMHTLFQNTPERYSNRMPIQNGIHGQNLMHQENMRMVTAGANLYSSQQNALKTQGVGHGIANTDYTVDYRRSVFANKDMPNATVGPST